MLHRHHTSADVWAGFIGEVLVVIAGDRRRRLRALVEPETTRNMSWNEHVPPKEIGIQAPLTGRTFMHEGCCTSRVNPRVSWLLL